MFKTLLLATAVVASCAAFGATPQDHPKDRSTHHAAMHAEHAVHHAAMHSENWIRHHTSAPHGAAARRRAAARHQKAMHDEHVVHHAAMHAEHTVHHAAKHAANWIDHHVSAPHKTGGN